MTKSEKEELELQKTINLSLSREYAQYREDAANKQRILSNKVDKLKWRVEDLKKQREILIDEVREFRLLVDAVTTHIDATAKKYQSFYHNVSE